MLVICTTFLLLVNGQLIYFIYCYYLFHSGQKFSSESLDLSHIPIRPSPISILNFEYRSRQTVPNQIGRDDPFDSDWLRKGLLELKNS